jgi:hypothetical protein
MGSHNKAAGDMFKAVYDPDADGKIALAQLVDAVCSETEAAGLITAHTTPDAHHTKYLDTEAVAAIEAGDFYVLATGEAGVILLSRGALLTVADMQVNAGTGTTETPQNINDGSTANNAHWDANGEYVEILLDGYFYATEFRQYGNLSNTAGDKFKLQFRNLDGDWVDNTLNIEFLDAVQWSDWASLTTPVWCTGIRVVCTALEGHAYMNELEVRGV